MKMNRILRSVGGACVLFAALSLCSCSWIKDKFGGSGSSVVAVDDEDDEEESDGESSGDGDVLLDAGGSYDLIAYELKGKVKSAKTSTYQAIKRGGSYDTARTPQSVEDVSFDELGRLTALKLYYPEFSMYRFNFTVSYQEDSWKGKVKNLADPSRSIKLERDSRNRISILADAHETDMDRTEAWIWEGGRLKSVEVTCWEWMEGWSLKYDAEGRIATRTDTFQEYSDGSETRTKYTYIKFDEQGNWTERAAEVEAITYTLDENDNRHSDAPDISHILQRRTITYF